MQNNQNNGNSSSILQILFKYILYIFISSCILYTSWIYESEILAILPNKAQIVWKKSISRISEVLYGNRIIFNKTNDTYEHLNEHKLIGLPTKITMADFGVGTRCQNRLIKVLSAEAVCDQQLMINIFYSEGFPSEAHLYSQNGTNKIKSVSVGFESKIVFEGFDSQDGIDKIVIDLNADFTTEKGKDLMRILIEYHYYVGIDGLEFIIHEGFIYNTRSGQIIERTIAGVSTNDDRGMYEDMNATWRLQMTANGSVNMVRVA